MDYCVCTATQLHASTNNTFNKPVTSPVGVVEACVLLRIILSPKLEKQIPHLILSGSFLLVHTGDVTGSVAKETAFLFTTYEKKKKRAKVMRGGCSRHSERAHIMSSVSPFIWSPSHFRSITLITCQVSAATPVEVSHEKNENTVCTLSFHTSFCPASGEVSVATPWFFNWSSHNLFWCLYH